MGPSMKEDLFTLCAPPHIMKGKFNSRNSVMYIFLHYCSFLTSFSDLGTVAVFLQVNVSGHKLILVLDLPLHVIISHIHQILLHLCLRKTSLNICD